MHRLRERIIADFSEASILKLGLVNVIHILLTNRTNS